MSADITLLWRIFQPQFTRVPSTVWLICVEGFHVSKQSALTLCCLHCGFTTQGWVRPLVVLWSGSLHAPVSPTLTHHYPSSLRDTASSNGCGDRCMDRGSSWNTPNCVGSSLVQHTVLQKHNWGPNGGTTAVKRSWRVWIPMSADHLLTSLRARCQTPTNSCINNKCLLNDYSTLHPVQL